MYIYYIWERDALGAPRQALGSLMLGSVKVQPIKIVLWPARGVPPRQALITGPRYFAAPGHARCSRDHLQAGCLPGCPYQAGQRPTLSPAGEGTAPATAAPHLLRPPGAGPAAASYGPLGRKPNTNTTAADENERLMKTMSMIMTKRNERANRDNKDHDNSDKRNSSTAAASVPRHQQ